MFSIGRYCSHLIILPPTTANILSFTYAKCNKFNAINGLPIQSNFTLLCMNFRFWLPDEKLTTSGLKSSVELWGRSVVAVGSPCPHL